MIVCRADPQANGSHPNIPPSIHPPHVPTAQESWIGPVALQLSLNDEDKSGAGAASKDSSPTSDQDKPVLRLFMHHKCCIGLEKHLADKAFTVGELNNKMVAHTNRPPKVSKLLQGIRDFEREHRSQQAASAGVGKKANLGHDVPGGGAGAGPGRHRAGGRK